MIERMIKFLYSDKHIAVSVYKSNEPTSKSTETTEPGKTLKKIITGVEVSIIVDIKKKTKDGNV